MRAPKFILIGAVSLFTLIGVASIFKTEEKKVETEAQNVIEEIDLEPRALQEVTQKKDEEKSEDLWDPALPDANLIDRLFATDSSKLPIVETVSYTSRVPWLKGRPAWVADYASHFATSRHFIARSLNKSADYFSQKVSPGDRFNVFRTDKDIEFQLVIDLSRCKMWFYYYDQGTNERVLLKTYNVGLGRKDETKASGYLTPTGKYVLGSKIAIYKPGTMGYFMDQKTEMIQVFGTRWIPFSKEVENCTENYKGYGIHGAPYKLDANGELVEDQSHIGKYESDGCIKLKSEDMEELFSIIITKPTVVQLVRDFHDADLPGEVRKGEL